jgi:hypothetical protein
MKRKKNKCPLNPPGTNEPCPLQPAISKPTERREPAMIVVRTERRSWLTIAITGFGALLLRYLKTVRERARTERKRPE